MGHPEHLGIFRALVRTNMERVAFGFSYLRLFSTDLKQKGKMWGHPSGSVVEHLSLAQVMILGSWDQAPHQASHREPASPSAHISVSLCVSLMNK